VLGLGLVAARGQRLERTASEQAHAVLRVAHLTAGCELEQRPRRAVGDAAREGHLGEIVEAVADHELRIASGVDERRDCLCWMLAICVDHEDGVGAESPVDACSDG
jgi:hypothetical protein